MPSGRKPFALKTGIAMAHLNRRRTQKSMQSPERILQRAFSGAGKWLADCERRERSMNEGNGLTGERNLLRQDLLSRNCGMLLIQHFRAPKVARLSGAPHNVLRCR